MSRCPVREAKDSAREVEKRPAITRIDQIRSRPIEREEGGSLDLKADVGEVDTRDRHVA